MVDHIVTPMPSIIARDQPPSESQLKLLLVTGLLNQDYRTSSSNDREIRAATEHLNKLCAWFKHEKSFDERDRYLSNTLELLKRQNLSSDPSVYTKSRTEKLSHLFEGTTGHGLRDFLFTPRYTFSKETLKGPNEHSLFEDFDQKISGLRLYFIELHGQAIEQGFYPEGNVDFVCRVLANTLNKKSDLGKLLWQSFLSLRSSSTPIKVEIWLNDLRNKANNNSIIHKKQNDELKKFIVCLAAASRGDFKNLHDLTQNQATPPPKILNLPPSIKLADPFEVILKRQPAQSHDSAVAQANIESSLRIQNSLLGQGSTSAYYWPNEIHEFFRKTIDHLIDTALDEQGLISFRFIRGLMLKMSYLTGLSFEQIAYIPIDPNSQSNTWRLKLSCNKIVALKSRPKRTNSAALPESLKDFCTPLGENIELLVHEFSDSSTVDSLKKNYRNAVTIGSLIGTVIPGDYKELCQTSTFANQILDVLSEHRFFTELGVRRQAFRNLSEQFDEATAELCLAEPGQSTSATTAYLCFKQHGKNVAGSQLCLTQQGFEQLIDRFTDRLEDALNDDNIHSNLLDIINLACSRVYLLQLICAGVRPVLTGIQNLSEIDLNNKMAIVTDKVVEGFEEARIIPLIDKLVVEIERLRLLLRKISTDENVPASLQTFLISMTDGQSPLPLWLNFTEANSGIFSKEIQPTKVIGKFAEEITETPNIFRHAMAQQVYSDSQSLELTMAALGHSSVIKLLYGPGSTRCRKDDVEEIRSILERKFSSIHLKTEHFWNTIEDKLSYLLSRPEQYLNQISTKPLVQRKTWGYNRRKENRKTEENRNLKKIDQILNDVLTDYENRSIDPDLSKQILAQIIKQHPDINRTQLNKALKKRNWPTATSTIRMSQDFPSHDIFKALERRSRFENWLRKHQEKLHEQEKRLADLIKLIYFFGLQNPTLALRCLNPKNKLLINDVDNTRYLLISKHDKQRLHVKNTQIAKIPLSNASLEVANSNLEELKLTSNQSELLLKIFMRETAGVTVEALIKKICRDAQSIGIFEKPAFLSTVLNNDHQGVPSNYANSLSVFGYSAPKIHGADIEPDSGNVVRHIKGNTPWAAFSESPHSGKNEAIELRKRQAKVLKELRKALRNLFDKPLKVRLKEIEDLDPDLLREMNWQHLFGWIAFVIFDSKKSKLKPKSVLRYLRASNYMLKLLHNENIELLDEECASVYVTEFLKWAEPQKDVTHLKLGLNSFLNYLSVRANTSFANFDLNISNDSSNINGTWISPRQYESVINFFGNGSNSRFVSSEDVRFISLLYRFGLRLNEAAGILLDDLYFLDNQLFGVVVRKNRQRDIKHDRPPRYVFLEPNERLLDVERKAWAEFFIQHNKQHLVLDKTSSVFRPELSTQAHQDKLKQKIRNLTKNPNLVFHSLRKGFVQQRFSRRVSIAKDFSEKTGLPTQSIPASCSAMDTLRRSLGHAHMQMTMVKYVHVNDQLLKRMTGGRRRGSAISETEENSKVKIEKIIDLIDPKPEEINRDKAGPTLEITDSTPTTPSFNISRIKQLLLKHRIQLTENELVFFNSVLPKNFGFHPSAPEIELAANELCIFRLKGKNSFLSKTNYQSLIHHLESLVIPLQPDDKPSPLANIVALGGEIILRNEMDFKWLRLLGEKPPEHLCLAYPRGLNNSQLVRLNKMMNNELWAPRLVATDDPLPNEVSEDLQSSILRVVVRSTTHEKKSDVLFLLLASALVVLEKQSPSLINI